MVSYLIKTGPSCVGHMPTNCLLKYANIILVAHTGESMMVAVFHLYVSSHSQPPWACILILPMYLLPWSAHSRKHTKCCPFTCFTQYEGRSMWYKWWSFQVHGNEESVTTSYQIFYRPLSPHDNIKVYTHSTPALLKFIIYWVKQTVPWPYFHNPPSHPLVSQYMYINFHIWGREERAKGKEEGNKGESNLGWRFVFVRGGNE